MKILVLTAPCVHLGYLGCYGSTWVRTPHLDGLAAEGIVFDQHYADCPMPSTQFSSSSDAGPNRSWWTGRYRFPGPTDQSVPAADAAHQLFPLLEAHGIGTARMLTPGRLQGAHQAPSLKIRREIIREAFARVAGFEQWLMWADLPSLAPPWPVPAKYLSRYFPEEAADEEEPLRVWMDPPEGSLDLTAEAALERLQSTYAAALTYYDSQLGHLLDELRDRAWEEQVLLVVTGDRGLALGEHGILGGYRPWMHDEFLHLPLLVRLPGGLEAGRRVHALTQPVDLFPTLLEAFGLPLLDVHGRSLWPLLRGEAERVRDYACGGLALGGAVEFALRTPQWAFLLPVQSVPGDPPRRPQLYVKPDDRWEVNDVRQHHLELAENLEQTLRNFVAATEQPGPFRPPPLADTAPTGTP
jgi:arylsulfatase A-like enzyme